MLNLETYHKNKMMGITHSMSEDTKLSLITT